MNENKIIHKRKILEASVTNFIASQKIYKQNHKKYIIKSNGKFEVKLFKIENGVKNFNHASIFKNFVDSEPENFRGNRYKHFQFISLSKKLHKNSRRAKIEREILSFFSENFQQKKPNEIANYINKNSVCKFYNKNKLNLPKKSRQNKLQNLCKNWEKETKNQHFQMKKQTKYVLLRKLT